jgi:alkylhydroperoxidase/carboxymuconolactone decarboxylase family protein YurZ
MSQLTDRRQQLKAEFIELRGIWSPVWDALLDADPDFFAAYLKFAAAPYRDGGVLDPKVKEFVLIAVDAAATHLYEPGIRLHIRRAIELGATKEELLEVLQLTSTLGIHAANIGVPILVEALEERGQKVDTTLSERQERLKAEFTENRGYWHPFWNEVLLLDPDFFEGYLEFSSLPWKQGVLEPKVKEFIYCAFDVAATHLYTSGLKLHIENALGYGATAQEIMEIIELASPLGMAATATALPILLEELSAAKGGNGAA